MVLKQLIADPRLRLPVGWALFLGSLIGWPISIVLKYRGFGPLAEEPVLVLSLSWLALIIEGWNALQIAEDAGNR